MPIVEYRFKLRKVSDFLSLEFYAIGTLLSSFQYTAYIVVGLTTITINMPTILFCRT